MSLLRGMAVGVVLSVLCISSAQALIIDNGSYTTDTDSGLDWLDLSLTDNMTYSAALSTYSIDGWVYATESQFEGMMDSIFSEYVENSTGYMNANNGTTTYSEAVNFQNLFGSTCESTNLRCSYGFYAVGNEQRLGGVAVNSTGTSIYRDYPYNYGPLTSPYANTSVGVYLVRGDMSSVPEPASIALMGLGLVGLGFARRKKAA